MDSIKWLPSRHFSVGSKYMTTHYSNAQTEHKKNEAIINKKQ